MRYRRVSPWSQLDWWAQVVRIESHIFTWSISITKFCEWDVFFFIKKTDCWKTLLSLPQWDRMDLESPIYSTVRKTLRQNYFACASFQFAYCACFCTRVVVVMMTCSYPVRLEWSISQPSSRRPPSNIEWCSRGHVTLNNVCRDCVWQQRQSFTGMSSPPKNRNCYSLHIHSLRDL